jgi:hypothetical protein
MPVWLGIAKHWDETRDAYLAGHGIRVLRFHSKEVLLETDSVVEVFYQKLIEMMGNPPWPPFSKGGKEELSPLAGRTARRKAGTANHGWHRANRR